MSDQLGPRQRPRVLLVSALLVAAACSGGGDGSADATTTTAAAPSTTATTAPLAEGVLDTIELSTTEVAKVTSPTALAARSSSPDLYVAEQDGKVRVIRVTKPTTPAGSPRYQLQTTPVLDLSGQVASGGERGLLGLAFSSDGRKLYVDYTAEPDGRTVVAEYQLGDRTTIDPKSRRVLLTVDQPAANHNGGNLVMGPDGYLYIGLGDGGGAGDPDGNGQDRDELLGSILRIDPEASAAGGDDDEPYGIPAGNPFADGEDGAPEIWTYGLRNPWRFSFDSETGDLWIADVGQQEWEEVTRLPATSGFDAGRGANLGWNLVEGSHPFEGENPRGGVLPIHEYSHEDGCSVVGGYVYRGEAIRELQGVYLFGDFCEPGLRGLQLDQGVVIDERTWALDLPQLMSFGQDNDGELFVLLGSGSIRKIVAAPGAPTTTTRQ